MSLKIYKMTFQKAHFGDGELNDSQFTFDASRLFSALTLEAIKLDKYKEFTILSQQSSFILSDAFPMIADQLYIPKPIGYPKFVENEVSDNLKLNRQLAKKLKELLFIPLSSLNDYLNNKLTISQINAYLSTNTIKEPIMKKGVDPYEVGVTTYSDSLYVVANQSELLDSLMHSLQYSGIGGKRSTGYGQFTLEILNIPDSFYNKIIYGVSKDVSLAISLSTSLPRKDEMIAVIKDAKYLIKKSSGFAYSTKSEELLRKQDFYKFKSGSTFKQLFTGYIKDVRPEQFPHPVWNYAKGIFLVPNLGKEDK